MFSDMNKITEKIPTATTPRTFQTDTREEIVRHDPEHEQRRRGGRGFKDQNTLFGDDQAEVSVDSLEAFLPLLLKNYAAKSNQNTSQRVAAPDIGSAHPNARAAGAYAKMAQYSTVPELREKVQEVAKDTAETPTLSSAEVQAIHRLQSGVQKLKEKGVRMIKINKAETFLESLQNGVDAAL